MLCTISTEDMSKGTTKYTLTAENTPLAKYTPMSEDTPTQLFMKNNDPMRSSVTKFKLKEIVDKDDHIWNVEM